MERSLPVSSGVYDAVIELQKSLIDEYGDDVTISDTIDFLGNQYFIHLRLLDIVSDRLEKMKETEPKKEPGMLDNVLGFLGLSRPEDNTCFIRSDIPVPVHWVGTRWLLDIQGRNVIKCLTGGEDKAEKGEDKKAKQHKINIR